MSTRSNTLKLLGGAFLLQFATSFFSATVLNPALYPSEAIDEVMVSIASQVWLMRANIFVDTLTALGIIFLGAMLFVALKKEGEKIALVGLGFYVLEAALLAVSRMGAFSLLRVSQEYVTTGRPEILQTMGSVALESMEFVGVDLHMLAFCLGALLFYYLLYKSDVVPNWVSLWGLITISLLLILTLLVILGYAVPFFLYVPYVPFELVVGIWILVKGIREGRHAR